MGSRFDEHERAQWAGRASVYRDTLAALCAGPAESLLDAAGVSAGVAVLDVGTGSGTVASLALVRGASVIAVDAEPSMVALAALSLPDVRLASLPELPFAAGLFDAAVANFVVNHVGDPLAAVAELGRVVRPGGRVAVTIWPHPQPVAQRLWADIFAAASVVRPPDLPRVEVGHDFPRSVEGLSSLFARSGYADVSGSELSWIHRTDPEAWWNGPAAGIGATGAVLTAQDSATRSRVRSEFDRLTAPFMEADGRLALPTSAVLVSAQVA
ncbi:Ubiquinone/menaquinone biosynthesis C-methylase UbiE [Asanoa hainanensis]|uniref:Ubiquinone/menaquinone biosynthesis C-methylase UbiE n=1 Tax=Asanoa hainanensis TaxID=560556 RepID=A0A239MGY4_9ACTN|nr:class I SAM-dependent methyltransferase [Asanoa hainanensis]SNT41364.1 Ubiquinone/menaquinone biosynthesis C-methylase UbiE [Asanoa hainanensis]